MWKQIQVQHPAAKSMIEISRTQDEEVGDGTTSVIILGKEKFFNLYIIHHQHQIIYRVLFLCFCISWRDAVCSRAVSWTADASNGDHQCLQTGSGGHAWSSEGSQVRSQLLLFKNSLTPIIVTSLRIDHLDSFF